MVLLSLRETRRLALSAQGIGGISCHSIGADEVLAAIRQMGLLQLDFVNILTPSHYLVLWSRLGDYDKALLDDVVYGQAARCTEHWAHEASIVPFELWPLLAYRRNAHRIRPYGFENHLDARYLKRVLREVTLRGALRSDELPVPVNVPSRIAGSWYGTVQRVAMEALFGRGDLAIAFREPNFARRYDLAERVVPSEFRGVSLGEHEQQRQLLQVAARACGVGTAADLADYFRMPASVAKPRISELVTADALEPVQVEGWREIAYRPRQASTQPPPDIPSELRLLSPFDPIVWFRKRTERLFGFEYRLEIFVPAEKRRWGCFCLPVLFGENLVARVDLRAERKEGVLAVLATFPEAQHAGSDALFCELLPEKLHALARWLGLERAVSRHPHRNRALRGTLASSRASRAAGRDRP